MADARQVAEEFFDAWTGKDFERARGLLRDDVSFEGPIDPLQRRRQPLRTPR
jgi:ketosteroid isomerase-like protein